MKRFLKGSIVLYMMMAVSFAGAFPVYAEAMPIVSFTEEQNSDIPVLKGIPGGPSAIILDKRRPLYINGQWFYYQGFLLNDTNYVCTTEIEKLFSITDLGPARSKMVKGGYGNDEMKKLRGSDFIIGIPLEALAQCYPNIQYYFEPVTQSIVMTTDGSNPQTSISKDLQQRIDTFAQQEQEIEQAKKRAIERGGGPLGFISALDVKNSEPRPIYKGSYDGQTTDAMNWVWSELDSCWIARAGNNHSFYIGIKGEESKIIIPVGGEEEFFKYYKLYNDPAILIKIVDMNDNIINASDYLGDYQPEQ